MTRVARGVALVKGSGIRAFHADVELMDLPDPVVVAAFRPTILGIVAFAVPLVIMLHVLSLWQLLTS